MLQKKGFRQYHWEPAPTPAMNSIRWCIRHCHRSISADFPSSAEPSSSAETGKGICKPPEEHSLPRRLTVQRQIGNPLGNKASVSGKYREINVCSDRTGSIYFCKMLHSTSGKILASIAFVRNTRIHLVMLVQIKQTLVVLAKFVDQIVFKSILWF